MGTSSPNSGPGNSSPLIPSWLGQLTGDGVLAVGKPPVPQIANPDGIPVDSGVDDGSIPPGIMPTDGSIASAPQPQSIPVIANRFTSPRGNFSRFARSGGTDRASFGRALSSYVRGSSGGARTAAQRMKVSSKAAAQIAGFFSDVATRGANTALARLNIQDLAGRPLVEVFSALTDVVCPSGGTLEEGIVRDAFIETIADLSELSGRDLDTLTANELRAIFERFVAHTIEDRILNDIGIRAIELPASISAVQKIQEQLHEFVLGAVHDAVEDKQLDWSRLDAANIQTVVDRIYEVSFDLIASMAEGISQ